MWTETKGYNRCHINTSMNEYYLYYPNPCTEEFLLQGFYISSVLIYFQGGHKMQWIGKLNEAINFLEINLNERINYNQAASIACCSVARFQNMFLFITDITPAEYVRRRRMALSAKELIGSNIKIIDLALKYGYESPEAFTRAFTAFHGISPSKARKFKKYSDYPTISISLNITGGHFTMETGKQMTAYKDILVKVERESCEETFKCVGLPYEEGFANIDKYHNIYKDKTNNKFKPYNEVGIGISYKDGGDYLFGCRVSSLDDIPEGMKGFDTGIKNFAVVTFRSEDAKKLVGGEDGPGDGMRTANDYIKKVWLPSHMEEVEFYDESHVIFKIYNQEVDSGCHCIEVYKTNIQDEPEMCYYIPLKEKE